MKNFSIKEPMEEIFGLPVYVHNNAAVVALSEYRYGIAREHEALLTILIRTGVGGSFINRGNIFVTNSRTTLEIGHMLIDMGGRPCGCGREGCLEPYVSEDAILSDLSARVGEELDIEGLDRLLSEEEPKTMELLSEKAEILAEGMRTLFQLFGPDSFLIVTRSERLSSFLEEKVRSHLSCEPNGRALDECAVLSCRYDPILAGIGAGDLVLDHFFS
jgi:predicted NBD/HSP70 family sugar kinase